jgi:hypothetical protein
VAVRERGDGIERLEELRDLLIGQRAAGSQLARSILMQPHLLTSDLWLIESIEEAGDVLVERPSTSGDASRGAPPVGVTDERTAAR